MRGAKPLYLFLTFLSIAFLINIGTLVLIHEEPRRGIIAFEMIKNHNFLQPTVLGEPYYKKPPLHNWFLVISSTLLGSVNEVALRLPSSLSVILTSLLIYIVGGRLVGRGGALAGAFIYPTLYIVLIGYGTKCEPDTLFSFLVAGASLLWLYFFKEGRKTLGWFIGYLLTSLALLTKGLPALQFFFATLISYGFITRRWKELLSKEHFIGAAFGLIPFLTWLIGVNTKEFLRALISEVISRAPGELPLLKALKRYLTYPFRLFLATAPWSLIGVYYYYRGKLSWPKDEVEKIILIAFLVDAILYWVFPGSRLRYLMPALPLLSLYLGSQLWKEELLHKRAKEIIKFTAQAIVPLGIVGGLIATANPHLTLKETVTFVLFLYSIYFFLAPRLEIKRTFITVSILMLIVRGFYSSYFYPIAQFKYPPVREVASKIVEDSSGYSLFTKTKYLQLCFYVEKGRDEVLKFSENPPKVALFLSQIKEGYVLREYKLGKRSFYLCSYGFKLLPSKKGAQGE